MKRRAWTAWFELTRDERFWIGVILAIFLVGLVVRVAYTRLGPPDADPGRAAGGAAGTR